MVYRILITGISLSLTLSAGAESLWRSKANREVSIFADRVAMDVGDILTIKVDESTSITTTVSKATNQTGSFSGSINRFFYEGLGTIDGGQYPNVSIPSSGGNYTGGGNITNVRTLGTNATVMVIDRLPNGNLIVEGARQMSSSGETQYVILRGVVRRDDISNDNVVPSSKVANASVEILEKGAIASAQKQGWIQRLLNVAKIW